MRWSVALVVLLLPMGSAAPYLQHMGDAARTGDLGDPGPPITAGQLDAAYRVSLPAEMAPHAPPLILEGSIYVLRASASGAQGAGLYRIDAATGDHALLVDLASSSQVSGFGSDGAVLAFSDQDGIKAYHTDGSPAWAHDFTFSHATGSGAFRCVEPAVTDGSFFFGCTAYEAVDAEPALAPGASPMPFAVRADDGGLLEEPLRANHGGALAHAMVRHVARTHEGLAVTAVAITGYVTGGVTFGSLASWGMVSVTHLGVDLSADWTWADGPFRLDQLRRYPQGDDSPHQWQLNGHPWTIQSGRHLVVAATDLVALTPGPYGGIPEEAWRVEVQTSLEDGYEHLGLPSMGFSLTADDELIGAAANRLMRIDATTGIVKQTVEMPHIKHGSPYRGALLTPSHAVIGVGYSDDVEAQLVVVERGNLAITFSDSIDDAQLGTYDRSRMALGDELLVVATGSGPIQVYGWTDANPVPPWTHTSLNLHPGGQLVLQGQRSDDVQGLRTKTVVDWGDGSRDAGDRLRFEHTYDRPGDYEVVLRVPDHRAVAYQVHVAPPPADKTILEEAFSAQNQETTFFALGLMVTALLAGIGAIRISGARARMRRELNAIGSETDPERIARRRSRIQALLLKGRLTEPQAQFIEQRIDHRLRELRLGVISEGFDDLPHGLVRRLQRALSDGRIESWERHDLEALVSQAPAGSRKRLRTLLDEWTMSDS